MRGTILLSALASCLVGCPIYHVNTLPVSEPLSQPVQEAPQGDFEHRSGIAFPDRVGELSRVTVTRFDTEGLRVAITYGSEADSCPLATTIVLSPARRVSHIGGARDVVRDLEWRDLQAHCYQLSVAVGVQHRIAEQETPPLPGEWLPGLESSFWLPGEGEGPFREPYKSILRCYIASHTWFITYRASFPEACAPKEAETFTAFRHLLAPG